MSPLPYTVNAEMYPPESRSLSASLSVSFNWLVAFLVTKFNSDLESAIGTGETYFCYATVCIAGAIAIMLLLPETKGKTPQQLAEKFKKGRSKDTKATRL